jgi:ACS family hexuronate transporter-like MFS transporter
MRPAARRRALLALILLSGVINYADRQIIAVLKPLLERDLGWSDADYGQLVSVFQFAAAASYLASGWVIDRIGLKWGNPLAVGSWSLAAVGHAAAHTIAQFTVVRVALGATEAMGTPAAVKAIATWFDARQRSFALGAMNAASNLGAIVTPLLVPPLALALGWRAAFAIVGSIGFVWVVAWVLLTAGGDEDGKPRNATAPPKPDVARVSWRIILRDRHTWAIAGAKALSDQVWWLLLFWMPDLFHRVFDLDLGTMGAPLAIIYVCSALGSLCGGFVTGWLLARGVSVDRARKRTMLFCALLVLPVPLVLQVEQYWIAVALLGLTLAAHQGFSANLFGVITDIVPTSRVASVTSIGALFGNLSGMTVLAVTGWLLAQGGSYQPLLCLASVSYLLALLWIHLLVPELRASER